MTQIRPPVRFHRAAAGLTSCLRSWVPRAAGGTGTACRCQRNAEHLAVKEEKEQVTPASPATSPIDRFIIQSFILPESDPLWSERSYCKTENNQSEAAQAGRVQLPAVKPFSVDVLFSPAGEWVRNVLVWPPD